MVTGLSGQAPCANVDGAAQSMADSERAAQRQRRNRVADMSFVSCFADVNVNIHQTQRVNPARWIGSSGAGAITRSGTP
ncbi:hypothetical protein AVXHC19_37000 [Acidovorax sacchari]